MAAPRGHQRRAPGAPRGFVEGIRGDPRASRADEDAFHVPHRSAPHYAAWQEVAARCVVPGSHVNTSCRPLDTSEEDQHR